MAWWIDDVDGSVLLSEGLRIDSSWDHHRFAGSRLSRGASRQADWFRPRTEVLAGRDAELWMCFRGRLQELRVRLFGADGRAPESMPSRARDMRHWTWLIEGIGAPGFSNAGGVLYTFPWGWVHAGRGSIHVSYPLPLPAVPLPGGAGELGSYRCMRCAAVDRLPYGQVTEVSRTRGGAPCNGCGEVAWVRVGSEAERQRISARPDYCEVGRHMTKGVRSHRLIAKADRPMAGRKIETRRVRACEDHRAVLVAGFYGFVLPEESQSR